MRYYVRVGTREFDIEIEGEQVTVAGQLYAARLRPIGGTPLRHVVIDGRSLTLPVENVGRGRWAVTAHGERWEVEVIDERTRYIRSLTGADARPSGARVLRAPMPGLVLRVEVAAGETVTPGAGLVVLEAMKMENELKAAAAGTVRAVRVVPGQAVEKGEVLVEFEGSP